MKVQTFFSTLAIAALATGATLLIATAPVLQGLGWPTRPATGASDPLALTAWWGFSFARVAAILLMGAGVCLWSVRHELSEAAARRLAGALSISLIGLAGIVAAQNQAIWSSRLGWGLFAILMFAGIVSLRMAKVTARPA